MLIGRLLLIVMVLTVPAAATWVLYQLSLYMLQVTGRIIADPQTLNYLTIGEFILFTVGALLEAKSRWSSPSAYQ